MRKFLAGFVTAAVILLLGGFFYVRLGYLDPRADLPPGSLEKWVAMPSLDAAVERRAGEAKNPKQADQMTLLSGMMIYQDNCALCHGDPVHPVAATAEAFNPRAPQFMKDAPDMPDSEKFYIIAHGIRLSGMPAWKQTLGDEKMWQVTTFLSHMGKLPDSVTDAWKSAAAMPAQ